MNLTDMIQQMCRGVLSQADIKAICKARSLPPAAADSHTLLETLFVSDTGLAAALQTLERNETAALHLLLAIDKPVDVSFFRRVYPTQEGSHYDSFTQQYRKVLAKPRRSIRREVASRRFASTTDCAGRSTAPSRSRESPSRRASICTSRRRRIPPASWRN